MMDMQDPATTLLKLGFIPWGVTKHTHILKVKFRFKAKSDAIVKHLSLMYPTLMIHKTDKGLYMVGGSVSPSYTNIVRDIKNCIEP